MEQQTPIPHQTKTRWLSFWPLVARSERARRARRMGLVAAGLWFLMNEIVAFAARLQPVGSLARDKWLGVQAAVRLIGDMPVSMLSDFWWTPPPTRWQIYLVFFVGDVINLVFWFLVGALVGWRARTSRRAWAGLLLAFGLLFATSYACMAAFIIIAFSNPW